MSEEQVYTRNHRTDVEPEVNNVLVNHLKYITSAVRPVPKIPYSCRFSRVISKLEIYVSTVSQQDEYKILCKLLYSVCLMCKDWAKKDNDDNLIVHVLVRVPREMKNLEEVIDDLCSKRGISPQPRSAENIEQDERKDWIIQMEKAQSRLSHPDFRDKCLALEGCEAEGMMQVMQRVRHAITLSL
ncbi:hypothetical protein PILCRDRAFT_484724 [Piloderma croceum F 1598]|uniref:Uncharacterized protein n=1 Tax=Piloderma croceum (strain F 1598) TaxID=765440 RepID=A0A0C3FBX1_PILCF|nr:hypothetical protein PILCRDRAFT_484724 [Piloderma croceum F 1598]